MSRRKVALLSLAIVSIVGCKSLIKAALVPDDSFADSEIPPAPDYADELSWAALPDREDEADRTPAGETDQQATREVDIFFIHPTTYYKDDFWNQPLDDNKTNEITDESVMRQQASSFNATGRIYAPRYRQATLGGYIADDWTSMESALNLAYSDIKKAFEYYLANWADGRPLILASHSQGSGHMVRLVHEFLSGENNADLRRRTIAVYAVGGQIPLNEVDRTFPDVPVCETPSQVGCIIVYNAIKTGSNPDQEFDRRMWYPEGWESIGDAPLICVNPVTWKADREQSAQGDHIGGVLFDDDDLAPEPDPKWLTATCREDGFLDVNLIESRKYGFGTGGDNLHTADYSLFYMDIRRNAAFRTDAFLAAKAE